MDDNGSGIASDLCVTLGSAKSYHFIWSSYNLRQSFPAGFESLPLKVFQEGRMIRAPVYKGMSDTRVSQRPEEHRGSRIHDSRVQALSATETRNLIPGPSLITACQCESCVKESAGADGPSRYGPLFLIRVGVRAKKRDTTGYD